MSGINISLKLEIIANNKVMVPGNEPIGDVTSLALAYQWQDRPPLADVSKILAAIPGSRIEFGDNWSGTNFGVRRKWLVLPPWDQECPCSERPDYYKIIRSVASNDEEEYEKFDFCDTVDQGFCPSPGWGEEPAPTPSPYRQEGDGIVDDAGLLPPVPPWSYVRKVEQ